MIECLDVWKRGRSGARGGWALVDASVYLPPNRRIALLTPQREDSDVVLRLLSGTEAPDRGAIRRTGLPCWPLDSLFYLDLGATFAQNVNFVSRVYGVDPSELTSVAVELSGIRPNKGRLMKQYSAEERKCLALALTLSLQFDWYFVNEKLPQVRNEQMALLNSALTDRLSRASIVWATTQPDKIAGYCDAGLVLDRGGLTFYNDFGEASEVFKRHTATKAGRRK